MRIDWDRFLLITSAFVGTPLVVFSALVVASYFTPISVAIGWHYLAAYAIAYVLALFAWGALNIRSQA